MPADEKAKSRRPTHKITQVEPRAAGMPYYRELGFGFENSDGSINLEFAALPYNASFTVQLRRIAGSKTATG